MDFEAIQIEKEKLIEELKREGITNQRILKIMKKLRRDLFVPEEHKSEAYVNRPLSIGHDQTISQPFIVAFMTESLNVQNGDKILEIGTGSGYQAAVLSELNPRGSIYSIEIVNNLALRAKKLLRDLNYTNVHVKAGDGYKGWPSEAPFDKIILTAAPEKIPEELLYELNIGGILIAPIGEQGIGQDLVRIERISETHFKQEKLLDVRFVPMVKEEKNHPAKRPKQS